MIAVAAGMAAVMAVAPLPPAVDDDREWAAARPDRSVSAIRDAATVPARWRSFAACVLRRESGATLDRPQSGVGARNPTSTAAGRWQFLAAWRHGLPYMVRDRLVRFGTSPDQARRVRIWLSAHPIDQWPGVYQDMGAFEVLERGGSFHWRLPGSACEAHR